MTLAIRRNDVTHFRIRPVGVSAPQIDSVIHSSGKFSYLPQRAREKSLMPDVMIGRQHQHGCARVAHLEPQKGEQYAVRRAPVLGLYEDIFFRQAPQGEFPPPAMLNGNTRAGLDNGRNRTCADQGLREQAGSTSQRAKLLWYNDAVGSRGQSL